MENTNPTPDPMTGAAADDSVAGGEEALGKLITEYETKLGEMREILMRERAELDNQRKRLVREVEQARKFANERLLGDLLPVFDSLEAGLQAAADKPQLREGLELTFRQLQRVAEANGLVAVDPVGQGFNPEQHQAISMADGGGAAAGTVLQVFQKGFLLNERLLRPALVVVAKD